VKPAPSARRMSEGDRQGGRKATESVMASKSMNPPLLGKALLALWTSLVTDLFNTYRPERHYMRGPGPKWRAKHARPPVQEPAGDWLEISA
jgi:hypothetical protein